MHYITHFHSPSTSTASRGSFLTDPLSRLILDTFPEYGELRFTWGGDDIHADVKQGENVNDPVTLTLDLPGYAKNEVSISLDHDRVLTVSAENTKRGKTEKQFLVSEEISADGISASLENGILTVTLPREKQPEPRKIEVA